jgi:hypothetical protein
VANSFEERLDNCLWALNFPCIRVLFHGFTALVRCHQGFHFVVMRYKG